MNELTLDKKIKIKRSKDNIIPQLPVHTDGEDGASPTPDDPIFDTAPTVVVPPVVTQPTDAVSTPKKPMMTRVFLTGRLKSGKDFSLDAAEFKILGLADPLYELANYFYPKQPKDLTREFLQKAGHFGRGEISTVDGLTVERALFVSMVRSLADAGAFNSFQSTVNWDSYGKNPDIWLDALLLRAKSEPSVRIGVSNVRFQNEKVKLAEAGFVGFHVMCSPQSYLVRLAKAGIDPNSPVLKDVSEALATALDQAVYRSISKQRVGPKLRVVWCDELVSPPSKRMLTIAEFKNVVGL